MKLDFKINDQERDSLKGLPWIQRLMYYEALRPYMDFATGVVGKKRGVSYQSISEILDEEPHVGYKAKDISRDQIKRGLKGLHKAGIIELISIDKKLILKCNLADTDQSIQNKAAPKPPQKDALKRNFKIIENKNDFNDAPIEAAHIIHSQAATPPDPGNKKYFYKNNKDFFEQFWQAYPIKKSKGAAWDAFSNLNVDENLLSKMLHVLDGQKFDRKRKEQQGEWTPAWKYPASWLQNQCWLDEINHNHEDVNNEKNTRHCGKPLRSLAERIHERLEQENKRHIIEL